MENLNGSPGPSRSLYHPDLPILKGILKFLTNFNRYLSNRTLDYSAGFKYILKYHYKDAVPALHIVPKHFRVKIVYLPKSVLLTLLISLPNKRPKHC